MFSAFDDDICWCANSAATEPDKQCNKIYCFRHLKNRKPQPEPDIYTCAYFKDTDECVLIQTDVEFLKEWKDKFLKEREIMKNMTEEEKFHYIWHGGKE